MNQTPVSERVEVNGAGYAERWPEKEDRMIIHSFLISVALSTTSVTITEPVDGDIYNGDWLTVRAIIENENELPDSVHYTLNGEPVIQIPRLNTDWPTYMQNQIRNGFSESPGPTDSTILWTAPVTGYWHIFHSPVVANGVVYFCHDSLYAMDAATGEVLWSHRVTGGDDAPVVSEGRLYWASDSIYCFNLNSHQPEWVIYGGDGCNSNPLLFDGNLYCAVVINEIPGTLVKCLNSFDGSSIWQKWYSGRMQASFAIWDDKLIFPTSSGPLYAVDPESGDIIWENSDSEGGYWDTSPCIVDGVIYIGGEDGNIHAIDALSGQLVWETLIYPISSIEATPAFCNGIVISGNRETIFAVEAVDGSVIWQNDRGLHGSATIADGLVYWGAWGGSLVDPDSIYAADVSTGEVVWSYMPDSTITLVTTPPIVDGILYFPAANGYLYAFGTGLKYTYRDDLYACVGGNELIVTSFHEGGPAAADTINFTVTGTGMNQEPVCSLHLTASPNPFVSGASISFEISESALTSLCIYDLTGREVNRLVNSEFSAGTHIVEWNGFNQAGETVSKGLYICRIESAGVIETVGLCLLR